MQIKSYMYLIMKTNYEDIVELYLKVIPKLMEEKSQKYYREKVPLITYPKFSIHD